jgi:excisionase family DNA binding protein
MKPLSSVIAGPAAVVVVLAFFLPWITISLSGMSELSDDTSGYDLAKGPDDDDDDIYLWAIPLIAGSVLVAAFLRSSAIFDKAMTVGWYVLAGVGGLAAQFAEYQSIQSDLSDFEKMFGEGVIEISYEIGWWLSLAGLGAFFVAAFLANQEENIGYAPGYQRQPSRYRPGPYAAGPGSSRPGQPFYSVADAARYLNISTWRVTELIESGKLAGVKEGGGYRISPAALESYQRRQVSPRPGPSRRPLGRARSGQLPLVVTVQEAAEYLNTTPAYVQHMIEQNFLKAGKVGNDYRIPRAGLEGFARTLSSTYGSQRVAQPRPAYTQQPQPPTYVTPSIQPPQPSAVKPVQLPDVLSVDEAAAAMHTTPKYIAQMIDLGYLAADREGNKFRITREALEKFKDLLRSSSSGGGSV